MDSEKDKISTYSEGKPIDKLIESETSNIKSVEEWRDFIQKYYDVFCRSIAKAETRAVSSENNSGKPIAVITGGQPGAGKTALLGLYKCILEQKYSINATINNADFYRFCLPGSYRISLDFPESASELTDPVVKSARKHFMNEAINQKQSTVIENTLGDLIAVDSMLEAGVHDVWIALMAVSREESLLSDFERYIKMKETTEVARLVSVVAHDKRYNVLNKHATQLEQKGLRILIHSRGKTEHDSPVIRYDSYKENHREYPNALVAMNSIRTENLKENIHTYPERINRIREKMESFGMTKEEKEELNTLEQIINLSIQKNTNERGL